VGWQREVSERSSESEPVHQPELPSAMVQAPARQETARKLFVRGGEDGEGYPHLDPLVKAASIRPKNERPSVKRVKRA